MKLKSRYSFSRCLLALSTAATLLFSTTSFGAKAELDQYGGWTGIKGKKTGFFHLEKIDGRNWFITPDGNVFYPVALSHMLSGETRTAAKKLFGNDKEAWVCDSVKKARDMGFNSALGGASSPERNLNGYVDLPLSEKVFEEEKFPYAVGVILMKHPWEFVEGETLPDIFDPAYTRLIEDRAAAAVPPVKDNPLVLGYYYGFGAFNHSQDWINHHMSLGPNSHGRVEITNLLNKRYKGDVKRFNEVYGMNLKRISDLNTKAELVYGKDFGRANYPSVGKRLDANKVEDFNAIVSHMCIHLYKMAHTAIRRHDKNHLILGSFIKEWGLTGESWKAAAPYLDLIAPQHWNEEIDISDLSYAADLPMIVSDEDVGFHYPNNKGNLYKGLVSHEARGEIYQATMMRHYKDPQTMGATFCMCLYDQELAVVHKDQETGIYTIDGKPRPGLISHIRNINTQVYEHAPKPTNRKGLEKLDETLRGLWEKHDIKAHLEK
jgi:hypothetical protein